MTFKVGDIVVCHEWEPVEGKLGFIEEIVVDPHTSWNKLQDSGKYSVYGLEEAEFSSGSKFYYGDFIGDTLEATGRVMTEEDLEALQYKAGKKNDKGMIKDLDKVKANLGRESGRNEPKESIFDEVKKNGN